MRIVAKAAGVLALIGGILAAIMVIGGPSAHRFGFLDWEPSLGIFALSILLSAITLVLALVGLVFGFFAKPSTGIVSPLLGGVLAAGILVAVSPGVMVLLDDQVPPIHDITTDTENPPEFVDLVPLREKDGASNPPDYAGEDVAEQQRKYYPDIVPMCFRQPLDTVFERAKQTVENCGWSLVAGHKDGGRIEAMETSFWFGFTDDVVIRVRSETPEITRLDIRSKSRVGISDLGVNSRRIRNFRTDFGTEAAVACPS